jgi:hypothetical protein
MTTPRSSGCSMAKLGVSSRIGIARLVEREAAGLGA